MKKLLLLPLLLILFSCGDDKDEPKQPEIPTMSTEYLKGKAYQEVGDEDDYLIFTKTQKMIEFIVREDEKTLWLYHECDFSVQLENHYYYLVYPRRDGKPDNHYRIWFDGHELYQNWTFQNIVIEYDYGDYIGKKETTYKQVGTADEILSKYSSYTKD